MPSAPAPFLGDPSRLALCAPSADSHPALLVSGGISSENGRFTVAAANPLVILQADRTDGTIRLIEAASGRSIAEFKDIQAANDSALGLLADSAGARARAPEPGPRHSRPEPGLFGFLTYEYGVNFDRMPRREPATTPALWFGLYPALYVADRISGKAWWITRKVNGSAAAKYDLQDGTEESFVALKAWIDRVCGGPAGIGQSSAESGASRDLAGSEPETPAPKSPPDWRGNWVPSLSKQEYKAALGRVRDYLMSGDIYQANLTVRYRRRVSVPPAVLFARLLEENPAPYAAFLQSPDWSILSTSPELFFQVTSDGDVVTRPVKGTVGRCESQAGSSGKANSYESPLAASAKDRAEHLMIVDLERNDLGKICEIGSVKVDPLMGIESFVGLDHMVSNVSGRLKSRLGPIDVLKALFPGGSISGAPKIRALEVIHELEPVPRGVYTGAIGWIGADGGAQFNIAIRTLIGANGYFDLHVGGGIVADSDPEVEYEECRIKGEAVARAVRIAMAKADSGASNSPRISAFSQK